MCLYHCLFLIALPVPTQSQGGQAKTHEDQEDEHGSDGQDNKDSASVVEQMKHPEQPEKLATPENVESQGKPTTPANPQILVMSEGFEIPMKSSFKEKGRKTLALSFLWGIQVEAINYTVCR